VAGPDRTDRPPVGVVRPAGGLPSATLPSTRAHGGRRPAPPGRTGSRSIPDPVCVEQAHF